MLFWCHARSLQFQHLSPAPQSTTCAPLISSVGMKIHHSAALPSPHQLPTSLVSTLSRLAMIFLFSFSVCFFSCLFVLFLFAVDSFRFGAVCLGVFLPRNSNFFPDFVLLVPRFHYSILCTSTLPTSIIV